MNKATSLYLDLVRALAAVVVFLAHAGLPFFSQGQTWLRPYGHEMLVIFFVLSGFVIAHAVTGKSRSWRAFGADRLSRLYSVLLPAVVLTAILDHLGGRLDPVLYASEVRWDHYTMKCVAVAAFLSHSWHFAVKAGSNSPLWSIAYEFWYYFLLGGFVFARRWWKVLPIVFFLAVTGYNIPLLLPVWLTGVAAYSICQRRFIPRLWGAGLALGCLLGVILVIVGTLSLPGQRPGWGASPPLFWSTNFVPDFMLGLLVMGNFIGVDAMLRSWSPAEGWGTGAIRFAAGRSFSLYALHFPLLMFCKAVIPLDSTSSLQVAGGLLLTLAFVLAWSEITEQRREPWRRLFRRLFGLPADRETHTASRGVPAKAAA